jgi:hypothetical protein
VRHPSHFHERNSCNRSYFFFFAAFFAGFFAFFFVAMMWWSPPPWVFRRVRGVSVRLLILALSACGFGAYRLWTESAETSLGPHAVASFRKSVLPLNIGKRSTNISADSDRYHRVSRSCDLRIAAVRSSSVQEQCASEAD